MTCIDFIYAILYIKYDTSQVISDLF